MKFRSNVFRIYKNYILSNCNTRMHKTNFVNITLNLMAWLNKVDYYFTFQQLFRHLFFHRCISNEILLKGYLLFFGNK